MTALAILQELDYQAKLDLYKGVPTFAVPRTKFSDKTANHLTKAIVAFLKLKGHMVWRQSSEGRYRPGKQYTDVIGRTHLGRGQFLPGTNKGHADVCAIINGTFTAVEVKINDKQSPAQKAYQKEVEGNGGTYLIAKDFQSFYDWYQNPENRGFESDENLSDSP